MSLISTLVRYGFVPRLLTAFWFSKERKVNLVKVYIPVHHITIYGLYSKPA